MALDDPNEIESGPSWARPAWRTETDDLTSALDPTQMAVAVKASAAKAGVAIAEADLQRAASDAIKAMLIIRTYRVRGHLAANLDPLGLSNRELPADLRTEFFDVADADLDRQVWLGGMLGLERATFREIVDILRANYCGSVGLE